MKLAVITDEIDADLDHALDVMAEYGVTGAELRQVWDKNIADTTPDDWKRVKASLDAHGVQAVGLATPFYKCDLPGEPADGPAGPLHSASARGLGDQIALLEHCIAAAHFLDAPLIRVFSFWKRGPLTPAIEEYITDAFAEPAALAEREGVTLILENEHACYLGTGAQTARVLAEINSPAVRAVWDPGNAFMDGEVAVPDRLRGHQELRRPRPRQGRQSRPRQGRPGVDRRRRRATIDWAGQFRALRADGYSGYLSLETHYAGDGSKEAASRACLDGLLRLLGQ